MSMSSGKGVTQGDAEYDPKTDGKQYSYSLQSPYSLYLKSQGFKPRDQFIFFFY